MLCTVNMVKLRGRVETKYLATLEAGISEAQTDEMVAKNLQLVVPASIQETYSAEQRNRIASVKEFIDTVSSGGRTASRTL